jgi:hypothetical protein
MQTVILAVATTPVALPAGIVPGKLRFSIQVADLSQPAVTQDVDGTTATFADVADGSYTATLQRLDSGSQPLGAAFIQSFAVVTPEAAADAAPAVDAAPTTYDAPVGLTVTFA